MGFEAEDGAEALVEGRRGGEGFAREFAEEGAVGGARLVCESLCHFGGGGFGGGGLLILEVRKYRDSCLWNLGGDLEMVDGVHVIC